MKNKPAEQLKAIKESVGFDDESPLAVILTISAMLFSLLLAGAFFYLVIKK